MGGDGSNRAAYQSLTANMRRTHRVYEVAPIGVIMAESPQIGMYLSDWGGGAKSKIEGTPVNFYVWLMMQMGGALTK